MFVYCAVLHLCTCVQVRKSCAEVWAVVQAFKADRAFVGKLVDGMRSTLLIDIERNYVHEEGVFEDRQSKHRSTARAGLTSLYRQMVEAMGRMYQIFKADPVAVQKAWSRFVKHMDRRVEAALRFTVKNSLTELQRSICGDPANKDQELTVRTRVCVRHVAGIDEGVSSSNCCLHTRT